MKQSILLTVIFMLIAGTCLAEPPQRDPDELHPNQVAVFMRAKLEHAKKLLEGLATEDYDAIEKNAQQLSLLSLASTWQVLQTEEYVRKSEDFRRATDDIKKAAERKSLDGATLSYMDMTLKCVQCHKYVRSVRTASLQSILDRETGK